MKPVLALAGLAAVAAAIAAGARRGASSPVARSLPAAESGEAATSPCPPRSLPDHGVCVPVPTAEAERAPAPVRRDPVIPRRPDRPPEPEAYRWPLAGASPSEVVFEAALEATAIGDDLEPRVTGVLVRAPLGTGVVAAALEGQKGKPTLLYSGELFGPTAVTRHRVERPGETWDYVVIAGNLGAPPDLAPGAALEADQRLGSVSDTLTPGAPSLYLDVRRVRAGLDPASLAVTSLLDPTHSIPVDPRNVLVTAKR